ncbi:MAG TPA: helix-turn-helix domain-containing protein [Acidimicrobiales bacterium]|nr:helix-turn-helix domain-containing protein [Acidimicrobiales bacterium]
MSEERVALYVRIPSAQARQLDDRARSLHRPKQDLVSDLISEHLDALPHRPAGITVHDYDISDDQVLTLAELAALLRIDEATVLARAAQGELPGRRFGLQWRFSRRAVFAWLEGSDGSRPGPGFTNSP